MSIHGVPKENDDTRNLHYIPIQGWYLRVAVKVAPWPSRMNGWWVRANEFGSIPSLSSPNTWFPFGWFNLRCYFWSKALQQWLLVKGPFSLPLHVVFVLMLSTRNRIESWTVQMQVSRLLVVVCWYPSVRMLTRDNSYRQSICCILECCIMIYQSLLVPYSTVVLASTVCGVSCVWDV